jgi:hypothetical protein
MNVRGGSPSLQDGTLAGQSKCKGMSSAVFDDEVTVEAETGMSSCSVDTF